ncbi:MAG TPA: class I SAM-dependent methyltransferase [Caldimonas sp.]|jgi:SAM-dependent methyltransferase|nr:class I SAM-dependent methyltransferase [Caldimonas sp.]HEX2540223.1 class I SAM-dependent methyltransferase [Caldimonas sp.]
MSPRSVAQIRYSFCSADSVVGTDFYAALKYPERAKGNVPYHLDAAHQLVLESITGRVLEIGCGGGQMRRWIKSRGMEYIGTDISKSRVPEKLREGGPDYLADAHFLPFEDRSFDAVYSAAVTEHIADPQLMMSEVLRVLKPGGVYMGNGSFLEPWHDDSYFHMSPLGAYRSLRRSGFEVRNVWPGMGYSGYTAMLEMGNKLCNGIRPLGRVFARLHSFGLTMRRALGREDPPGGTIAWEGRMAGAVDWIARRPLH